MYSDGVADRRGRTQSNPGCNPGHSIPSQSFTLFVAIVETLVPETMC